MNLYLFVNEMLITAAALLFLTGLLSLKPEEINPKELCHLKGHMAVSWGCDGSQLGISLGSCLAHNTRTRSREPKPMQPEKTGNTERAEVTFPPAA